MQVKCEASREFWAISLGPVSENTTVAASGSYLSKEHSSRTWQSKQMCESDIVLELGPLSAPWKRLASRPAFRLTHALNPPNLDGSCDLFLHARGQEHRSPCPGRAGADHDV